MRARSYKRAPIGIIGTASLTGGGGGAVGLEGLMSKFLTAAQNHVPPMVLRGVVSLVRVLRECGGGVVGDVVGCGGGAARVHRWGVHRWGVGGGPG